MYVPVACRQFTQYGSMMSKFFFQLSVTSLQRLVFSFRVSAPSHQNLVFSFRSFPAVRQLRLRCPRRPA
ncbi:MAG: hypothetical protein EA363_02320, partial [Balneolaceae bacterium]